MEPKYKKINAVDFYAEYHGHTLSDLHRLYTQLLLTTGKRRFIYLMGDSSLDNKHWFYEGYK